MSEHIHEALSALKDDEAEELELRRLLKHPDTLEVNRQWRNMYQLSDAMSGRPLSFQHWDISGKVSAAIIGDSAFSAPADPLPKSPQRLWLRPMAGFAVAASVAVAVVLGTQTLTHHNLELNTSATPSLANRVYPALSGRNVSAGGQQTNRTNVANAPVRSNSKGVILGDLAAEQRLQKYMLQHTEQSSLNNSHGMINFARVASFDVD
jgi:sigma-E factor negative regulatory protein RseA